MDKSDKSSGILKPNYCSRCGAKLPKGADFCPKCGEPIRELKTKEKKASLNKFLNAIIVLFSLFLFASLAALIFVLIKFNSFKNKPLEREEIIASMVQNNIEKEKLDDDAEKVKRILDESSINRNTILSLKDIPIYVQGQAEIKNECNGAETSGCITSKGIFLIQQSSLPLYDWMTVIYDHEALHYLYEKLDNTEKKRVEALLEDYYKNSSDEFKKDIDYYGYAAKSKDWYSEIHSRVATQEKSIPDALEQYYSKYFDKRQSIVEKYLKIKSTVETAAFQCQLTKKYNDCSRAASYVDDLATTNSPLGDRVRSAYGF